MLHDDASPLAGTEVHYLRSEHVGDVTLLRHHDDPAGGATFSRPADEPVDERGLADARRPVDDDDHRLAVDRSGQPPRQLGALRNSPDDVDHSLTSERETTPTLSAADG